MVVLFVGNNKVGINSIIFHMPCISITLVAVIKTLAAKYQRCVQAKQSSALPSMDGPYARHSAIPRQPNATVTPTVKRVDAECVTARA